VTSDGSRDGTTVRALLSRVADEMPGGPVAVPPALLTPSHRPRRRLVVLVTGFAVVLVAAAVPIALRPWSPPANRGEPHPLPSLVLPRPTGSATASELVRGTWSALPPAPIEGRSDAATVWTGRQMLVWGGRPDDGPYLDDGAAYDPAQRRWQKMPPSPLGPRSNAASVWTGKAMFVWGGSNDGADADDGALYDPQASTWRKVAPAPLGPRADAVALWTGSEVLVLGGHHGNDSTEVFLDGAAYDPTTDTWQSLPSIPFARLQDAELLTFALTPVGLDVWLFSGHTEQVGQNTSETTKGIDAYRLDATSGRWTKVDPGELDSIGTPLWTGDEVIFPASAPFYPFGLPVPAPFNLHGLVLDAGGTWHSMTHGPVDDLRGRSVWTGAALLTFDTGTYTSGPDGEMLPGAAAAWDPATDSWLRLPGAPAFGADSAVWTGAELIEWGAMFRTDGYNPGGPPPVPSTIGLAFTPSD
jgi:hypothetical protein